MEVLTLNTHKPRKMNGQGPSGPKATKVIGLKKTHLTIAGGEWGGGFTGATIKDTWTKSRGRVEAEEGGGFGWGGGGMGRKCRQL